MSKDNLKLWNEVRVPDPKYVKSFNRSGGFKGSSTNATWLAMRATEVFGPYGKGWGLNILDEQYVEGSPITVDGQIVGNEKIHVLRAQVWYVLDGERIEGPTQFGQTTFVGKNKFGSFTDEEAPKKSLTDAMSKCFSLLGFCADIHMGMYDDNKYQNDAAELYAAKMQAEAEEAAAKKPLTDKQLENLTAALGRLDTLEALDAGWEKLPEQYHNDPKAAELFAVRKGELTKLLDAPAANKAAA